MPDVHEAARSPTEPAHAAKQAASDRSFGLLTDLAPRLSYKPGYRFSVERVGSELVQVSLTYPVHPHAVRESDSFGLTISDTFRLAKILAPSDALQAFATVIARYELHEAAEFFRVDGSTVFAPHRCGDAYGDFSWPDFSNLGGKHLQCLCKQLEGKG
jgi:hypothetical protein